MRQYRWGMSEGFAEAYEQVTKRSRRSQLGEEFFERV